LGKNELNRMSFPGDVDYAGCCVQDEQGNWHVRKQPVKQEQG
jgi:hypothetical protein